MKVQELRQLLSSADRVLLEKAFVESYKQFSKAKKEEVDGIIFEVLQGTAKSSEKKAGDLDFDALDLEIVEFLENAYAQNYFAPNRFVPKSKRPKWRFMVKNYIKALEKIPAGDGNYARAVELLTDLYAMLCYACSYYLFSTDDPFRSVGWKQPELFNLVAKKAFEGGYTRENITDMIIAAAQDGLSREALHEMQLVVLCNRLETEEAKRMALDIARELRSQGCEKLEKSGSQDAYFINERKNTLCSLVLLLGIVLGEPGESVAFFFKYCMEWDKEIILYRALDLADWAGGDDQLWVDIYKYGLKQKIKPREALVKEYKERREHLADQKSE